MLKWFKRQVSDRTPPPAMPDAARIPERMGHLQAVKRQGDENVRTGRYGDAERCYREIVEVDNRFPGALVMLGFVLREQGRTNEAREVLEHAVSVAAGDADGYYLLASILGGEGKHGAGISHLKKAIELRPDFEFARRQLIDSLSNLGRYAEARDFCQESIAHLPNSAELHFRLSNLYLNVGEPILAIACSERAISLDPGFILAQQNLSRLLFNSEEYARAEVSYRREIELTPEHFGPHHMLGVALNRMGRHAEAVEQFTLAISLNPASGASYSSLAACYMDLDDTSEGNLLLARTNYEKAVDLEPSNSEFLCNLGFSYWRDAELDRALKSFDRSIEVDPQNAKARWARVMLWAPAFSAEAAENSLDRAGFGEQLSKFEEWWAGSAIDGDTFVGDLQPFFLTYQEENNLSLLKQYGHVCARAMQRWLDGQPRPALERPREKRIRLGIVSADIRLHSVWIALIKGWFLSFDSARFELVVFSLARQADSETTLARSKSDVFVTAPKNLTEWVAAIREQNCEVILYPAVGLDPLTLRLASLRLAPIQLNTWGHPDTSGLPTLDYYVSAECFEHADSQVHYSEKLVLLPHLGNRLQPLGLSDSDPGFAAMNIDLERPILVCPGTPYKYQPVHDHVFPDIARIVPNAQFIFFARAGSALAKILQSRITKAFEAVGLDVARHVRFIRWLNFREFHCLLRNADVLLDTIGFSGYNTAVQAIECGLPLVTREGRFLRGRLASGVLRRMNLHELIVQNKADYVDMTTRLISDAQFHAGIRRRIEQSRSVLFDDRSALTFFQDFLESVARPNTTAGT